MRAKKQLCLGLDTTSDMTSVACLSETGNFVYLEQQLARGQGEALFPLIHQVLERMHKKASDLTCIAVTVGPGSFTGVRIGLATARGLALALDIPVYGVDNFMATVYHQTKPVTVVLDSKRNDFFVQNFNAKNMPLSVPSIQTSAQLKMLLPFIACGSGALNLKEQIDCQIVTPKQSLALAAAQIVLNDPKKTREPHPLYLRDADVTV